MIWVEVQQGNDKAQMESVSNDGYDETVIKITLDGDWSVSEGQLGYVLETARRIIGSRTIR